MALFENVPYTNFQDLNLDYLIRVAKYAEAVADQMEAWKVQHTKEYQELKDFMDALKRGDFPPEMEAALRQWCVENVNGIINDTIQQVWFGLTDTGYFVAYIPESWSDITFDTEDDYNNSNYGHLILRTNVYRTYGG